jgi:hypothetical protein
MNSRPTGAVVWMASLARRVRAFETDPMSPQVAGLPERRSPTGNDGFPGVLRSGSELWFIEINQGRSVVRNTGDICGTSVHFYDLSRVSDREGQLDRQGRVQCRNGVDEYAVTADAADLASLGALTGHVYMNMHAIDELPGTVTSFGHGHALGGPIAHRRQNSLTLYAR